MRALAERQEHQVELRGSGLGEDGRGDGELEEVEREEDKLGQEMGVQLGGDECLERRRERAREFREEGVDVEMEGRVAGLADG